VVEVQFFVQPAGTPPSAETIRARAAEVLARDGYDLEVHGRERSWLRHLFDTLLDGLLAPLRWIYDLTEGLPGVFRWLIILALVGLLGLIVWHMLWTIMRAIQGDGGHLKSSAIGNRRQIDPEELEQEAEAAGRRGDYVTAVRRLFRAAVVRLERSEKRALRPGTTNRGLLRRYGDRPTLGGALRLLADMVDRKWYGDEPCSEAEYAACRTAHRDVREVLERQGFERQGSDRQGLERPGLEGATHVQRA